MKILQKIFENEVQTIEERAMEAGMFSANSLRSNFPPTDFQSNFVLKF